MLYIKHFIELMSQVNQISIHLNNDKNTLCYIILRDFLLLF